MLAATAFHRDRIRAPSAFRNLSAEEQGAWFEWLVAQELWRRASLRGDEQPEELHYWAGKNHEIDYVSNEGEFLEVKRGPATPLDFAWFPRVFPRGRLTVITQTAFETDAVRGIPLRDWLLEV